MNAENKAMSILSLSWINGSFSFMFWISDRPRYCSDRAFTLSEFIFRQVFIFV